MRDIAAVRQDLAAGGHDMVQGDIVAHLQQAGQLHCVCQRLRHGQGLIFGPRSTSTLSYSSSEAGRSTMLSLMGKASGMATDAAAGTEVGSVIYPVRQLTAAVSGLTRYTPASRVPLRPSKLRLNVRRETPAELGLWPMPMQGPQALSECARPRPAGR